MIVITTPTGQIGRQVLGHLLESGEQLRVIARDPSQLPAGIREDLDIVEGSHGDGRPTRPLRYVAHWRSERASKAAASGDDRPGPISATGRAGGCQTSTVIVPPRSAFVGGLGS